MSEQQIYIILQEVKQELADLRAALNYRLSPVVSMKETCDILNLSPNTIKKLIKAKKIEGEKDGHWKISRPSVMNYFNTVRNQKSNSRDLARKAFERHNGMI